MQNQRPSLTVMAKEAIGEAGSRRKRFVELVYESGAIKFDTRQSEATAWMQDARRWLDPETDRYHAERSSALISRRSARSSASSRACNIGMM